MKEATFEEVLKSYPGNKDKEVLFYMFEQHEGIGQSTKSITNIRFERATQEELSKTLEELNFRMAFSQGAHDDFPRFCYIDKRI